MITIVSGLPRSGTSLTMQMLNAAGYPIYWDREPNCRPANPRGYYEFAGQHTFEVDTTEKLRKLDGSFVKLFPENWPYLLPEFLYRFIYINRPIEAVRASQIEMMRHEGWLHEAKPPEEHLEEVRTERDYALDFLKDYPHLLLQFDDLYNGIAQEQIGKWLDASREQIESMKQCVEPELRHF